jgi:hypothetical protein
MNNSIKIGLFCRITYSNIRQCKWNRKSFNSSLSYWSRKKFSLFSLWWSLFIRYHSSWCCRWEKRYPISSWIQIKKPISLFFRCYYTSFRIWSYKFGKYHPCCFYVNLLFLFSISVTKTRSHVDIMTLLLYMRYYLWNIPFE